MRNFSFCFQTYELQEFEVPYVIADSAWLGLHHMRAGAPPCHTHQDPSKWDLFDDYKQDVAVRSDLFSEEGVVITPAIPPPCPARLAAITSPQEPQLGKNIPSQVPPDPSSVEGGAGPSPLQEGAADVSNISSAPPGEMAEQNRAVTPDTPIPELGLGGGASTGDTPTPCSPVHSTPKKVFCSSCLVMLSLAGLYSYRN